MPPETHQPPAEDLAALLRAGIDAVRAGQTYRGRSLLRHVVSRDPDNPRAWLWLSGVEHDLDKRRHCLRRVLELAPGNDAAKRGLLLVNGELADQLIRRGILAARTSQRDRARRLLARAVFLDPARADGWLWLSGVTDDLEERRAQLNRVLALDPESEAARQGLDFVRRQAAAELVKQGIAAIGAGDAVRGEGLIRQATEEDDQNADAWLWLSGVVSEPRAQKACLERVLALEPDNDAAHAGLEALRRAETGRLLRDGIRAARAGRRDAARSLLAEVVQRDPQNASAWLWLSGVIPGERAQRDCLERVLALDPGNTLAKTGLAWLKEQQAAAAGGELPSSSVVETAQAPRSPVGPLPFGTAWYARSLSIAGAALIVVGLLFAAPAVADFARSRLASTARVALSPPDGGATLSGAASPLVGTEDVSGLGGSVESPETRAITAIATQAPTTSTPKDVPAEPMETAAVVASVTPSSAAEPTGTVTPAPGATPARTETLAPTSTKRPTVTPAPTQTIVLATAVLTPNRIVIPSVGIDGPVVASSLEVLEDGGVPEPAWVVPEATNAGWHNTSAPLGVPGNTVINGHNWPQNGIFRSLYSIEPGALIVLYSGEKAFAYIVSEAIIVKEAGQPSEVRMANARRLLPTDDERLTIVTCHPYGSTRDRLIVTARPVPDGEREDDLLHDWRSP